MAGNLDQSLDEIIGKRSQNRRKIGPRRAGKQVNVHRSRAPVNRTAAQRSVRAPVNAVSRVARLLNSNSHVKVNVEGLPRDIKQDAVREFFSTHVGGVTGVLLSYNERGLSTGMANITFKNGDLAQKAVAKFNGAPIDNGRSRLRLNIIVSASAASTAVANQQDLSKRIKPLPGKVRSQPAPQRNVHNRQRGPNRKAVLAKRQHQRKPKPAKKSLEDLDKEMADYFEDKKA
ncbi:RNA-binding protein YRA1 PWA37_001497 [Arxiozyma heterogenica]|uniref:RRM domain-containing protein n=1 Tax=Arxiozyma heterogenica TaxID=278026 RepID=A0AAN7W2Z1_9SACH|nr:hypothetical protein RI543_002666 [Kazachstania heterogenica]